MSEESEATGKVLLSTNNDYVNLAAGTTNPTAVFLVTKLKENRDESPELTRSSWASQVYRYQKDIQRKLMVWKTTA